MLQGAGFRAAQREQQDIPIAADGSFSARVLLDDCSDPVRGIGIDWMG